MQFQKTLNLSTYFLNFTKSNFGDMVAFSIRKELEEQTKLLASHPLMGKEDANNSTPNRKFRYIIVKRRSKVYYYVQNNTINIVLVWDVRQNIRALKKILLSDKYQA